MLQVVCTQPRRAAAAQVAQRVAEETNTQIGTTVGFCARFQDVLTPVRASYETVRGFPRLETCHVLWASHAHLNPPMGRPEHVGLSERGFRRLFCVSG